MPSSVDPSTIKTGAGKVHVDVVSAAADLYASGASALVASFAAVISQPLAAPSTSPLFGTSTPTLLLSSADGPFYVGSDPSESLNDLFRVVRSYDDAEMYATAINDYVRVTAISPATIGSGFFAGNLTLTLNTPVPSKFAADQYKVIYGKRVTVATLPPELSSFPSIRRAADRPEFPIYVKPINEISPTSLVSPAITNGANSYPDPYLAHWKAIIGGGFQLPLQQTIFGGAVGFVNVNGKKNVNDFFDQTFEGHQSAGFLSVYQKSIAATTLGGQPVFTKIESSLTAVANPIGVFDIIQLNVADFFYTTPSPYKTSIRIGVDMLKITYLTGAFAGQEEVFIINGLDPADNRQASLSTLGGAAANLGPMGTLVQVTWIRPEFYTGGDNESALVGQDLLNGMGHYTAGALTANPVVETAQASPFFGSGTLDTTRGDTSRNNWNLSALRWGSHVEQDTSVANIGQRRVNGEVYGDGSVQSYGGHINGLHQKRSDNGFLITVTGAISWNPFAASKTHIQIDGSSSVAKVITLTLDPLYLADIQNGDEITIVVFHVAAGISRTQSTIVWPTQFYFSGNDADVRIGSTPDYYFPHFKFTGIRHNGKFLMSRSDYITIDSL